MPTYTTALDGSQRLFQGWKWYFLYSNNLVSSDTLGYEGNPTFSFEVADRYATARAVTDDQVATAQIGRDAIIVRMNEVFDNGDVVVCLPSTVGPAPLLGQGVSERHELRMRNSALTSVAGNSGRPQLSLPLAVVDGRPVGLSLLGDYGSDEQLIALAVELTGRQVTC